MEFLQSIPPSMDSTWNNLGRVKYCDNVVRAMSFMRLSSDTGDGADDAVDADAGAGSDTAGSAWLTGFFFNMVFFSGMVMYQ